MNSFVNNGNEISETENRESCSKISNDEVVNLFYSIFAELKWESNHMLKAVDCILDRKRKLHKMICSKLRFPCGSVLKGIYEKDSFKIEVVNDVEDFLERRCQSQNLTYKYVFETYKNLEQNLPQAGVQEHINKLRQILCQKIEVQEEIVDSYNLELKVLNEMKFLKRLKENNENEEEQRIMETVFLLPVRKKNLLVELQSRTENINLAFLQSQNKELSNGLLIDVFKAVNKDMKELHMVLCSQFTKLKSVKLSTLSATAMKTMNEASNYMEQGLHGELKTFLNLPAFKSLYSVESTEFCTQEVKVNKNKLIEEKCTEIPDKKCTSYNQLCKTRDSQDGEDSDTDIDDPYKSDNILEENEKLGLILDVQDGDDIEDGKTNKRKRKAYDNVFKLRAVKYAENTSNRAASKKFGIGESSVRDWRRLKDMILQKPRNRKRNVTRAPDLDMIEKDLCKWFLFYQKKGIVLGKIEIMTKGKMLATDPKYKVDTSRHLFGIKWCDKFLKSNNLTLCRTKAKGKNLSISQTLSCSMNETDMEVESFGDNEENRMEDIGDCKPVKTEPIENVDTSIVAQSLLHTSDVVGIDLENSLHAEIEEPVKTESDENNIEPGVKLGVVADMSGNDVHERLNSDSEAKAAHYSDVCDNVKTELETDKNLFLEKKTVSRRKRKCSFDNNACKLHSSQLDETLENTTFVKVRKTDAAIDDLKLDQSEISVHKESITETIGTDAKKFEDDLLSQIQEKQKEKLDITSEFVATKAKSLYEERKYCLNFCADMFSNTWAQKFLERHNLVEGIKDTNLENPDVDIDIPQELKGIPQKNANELEFTDMLDEIGKKTSRQSYDNAFKSIVINFAESSSNHFAAKVYNTSESNIRSWRKCKDRIISERKDKKRFRSGHSTYGKLEKDLALWCEDVQKSGKRLLRSAVRSKASQLAKEGKYKGDMSQFQASKSWCTRFLERHNLTCDNARAEKESRQSYDNAFKSIVINFAESSSNNFAAEVYKTSESNVREWRNSKEKIINGKKGRKRFRSSNSTLYGELEKDLALWCKDVQKSGKRLLRAAVRSKASQLAMEGNYKADMSKFRASKNWCTRFLERQGLTCDYGRFYRGKKQQELGASNIVTTDEDKNDGDECWEDDDNDDVV
ncbi:uncharacterized protein LOC132752604 [Ruditapes philippinarum]|uniref:uncharacterized protein LOC132752604 n=1 Tax=Ruditapes philippinarum TaxID=129788 RepID=UPI00295B0911|nr:uncharacterized protein LOC132752604 [Ruditapes philippinarum]XP_060598926.1 uncharacterized protein LOC132752604 [Ruditapes philippinarum]